MNSTNLNCQNVVLNFMCCVKFMYLCVENPRKQVGLMHSPRREEIFCLVIFLVRQRWSPFYVLMCFMMI